MEDPREKAAGSENGGSGPRGLDRARQETASHSTAAESVEAGQADEKGRGCFYAINTLMILGLLVPVLILLIFFILWLIPD